MSDPTRVPDGSRREALKKIALGTGWASSLPILGQGARAAAHAHQSAQATVQADANWKPLFFDDHQNETVIALTELIIPETDTPGAKGALVNRFIDLWLSEEDPVIQKRALEGLGWIDNRSLSLHGKPFVQLTSEEQTALLTPLADSENKRPEDQPGVQFFQQLKDFTIFGYYTSQVGMEQELHYGGDDYHDEFPGACIHSEH